MLLGNVGRPTHPQQVRPAPEFDEPETDGAPVRTGVALPPGCVRVLHDPFGRLSCVTLCPGVQRDGGCLCDVVRDCAARGVAVEFEIDADGYWIPAVGEDAAAYWESVIPS